MSRLVEAVGDDPKLAHAIETIIEGFNQSARKPMASGKFTLRDLAGLPPITPNYLDRKFTCIYVRFYTNLKDIDPKEIDAYVG